MTDFNEPSRDREKLKNKAIATSSNEEHEHEEHDEDDTARVGGGGDSDNQTLQEMAPIRKLTANARRERIQKGTQEEIQSSELTQDEGQTSGTQGEGGVTKKVIANKTSHLVPISLKKTDFEEYIPGLPRDGGALLFGYKDSWAREIWETKYHSDAIRLLKPTVAPEKALKHWPLDGECERFKRRIANSGLASPAENSMLDHDRVAISDFVERMYPETDTFHMPFGEMTITLDVTKKILNLNEGGVAVKYEYTKQLSWAQLYDLCNKCLGWDKETADIEFNRCFSYKTRQFNMSQLIKMFKGAAEKEKQGP
ncbi:uncharacterized protein LOC113272211 [Papaver somniferum]|uniref:uncharacterized protein LOC113272211 n=1 Tax=Papaver somniferum TaxID=3469 RepID=UPI000E700C59|nr:uncharacterized protein LOC113272211 [Papaver somniferum]